MLIVDEEEFAEEAPKKKELKIENIPKHKMQTSPIYVIEYVLGACLAGYIFNYILGRVSNDTLAQR